MSAVASAARSTQPARSSARGTQTGSAAANRRPKLVVVGEPRYSYRYLLTAIAVAGVGVFGVVGLHALAAEQAFEVRSLEREVNEAAMRYDELTAEIAGLESPARVRQVATLQLGMVPATQPGFIVVDGLGATESDLSHGTLPAASDDSVADPVKQVLAEGQ